VFDADPGLGRFCGGCTAMLGLPAVLSDRVDVIFLLLAFGRSAPNAMASISFGLRGGISNDWTATREVFNNKTLFEAYRALFSILHVRQHISGRSISVTSDLIRPGQILQITTHIEQQTRLWR
jgi:hypothetical protein